MQLPSGIPSPSLLALGTRPTGAVELASDSHVALAIVGRIVLPLHLGRDATLALGRHRAGDGGAVQLPDQFRHPEVQRYCKIDSS